MMKWLGTIGVLATLAFAAGCSGDGEAPPAGAPSATVVDEPAVVAEAPAIPAKTEPAATQETKAKPDDAPDKEKNSISVASPQKETILTDVPDDLYMNEDDREQMQKAEEARQEFNRRNYDVTGTFDPLRPSLMGIALGAGADVVTQRFGEPTENHMLPDESEEAAVYSYPGFAFGIREGKVLFVEVSTRSVSPGLNGLRLGDSRADAVKKLGAPSADSEYVMSYLADGAVLKFDLDPETDRIHSMKLFPEE
ncbi:MAG TPA: hypothetical protein VEZ72_09825 [Paenibacillus sp.]|nr:hypothetical protein [Paenibacillus sp.]